MNRICWIFWTKCLQEKLPTLYKKECIVSSVSLLRLGLSFQWDGPLIVLFPFIYEVADSGHFGFLKVLIGKQSGNIREIKIRSMNFESLFESYLHNRQLYCLLKITSAGFELSKCTQVLILGYWLSRHPGSKNPNYATKRYKEFFIATVD